VTNWHIELEEVFRQWTPPDIDEDEPRLAWAVLSYLGTWLTTGAPDDAEYDDERDTFSCPVPGTPLLVEFLVFASERTIVLLGIR
jgi:hypothetical protein